MRRLVVSIIGLWAILLTSMAGSTAGTVYSLAGDVSDWTPTTNSWFSNEVTGLSVTVDDSNTDIVEVRTKFKYSIQSDFLTGNGSNFLVRLKVYKREPNSFEIDTYGDIWIDAPNVNYERGVKYDAATTTYLNEATSPTTSRQSASCGSKVALLSEFEPKLLSFTFSRLCLGLSNVFWFGVQLDYAKTSFGSSDFRSYPLKALRVDLSPVTAPTKHTQSFVFTNTSDQSIATPTKTISWTTVGSVYGPGQISLTSLTPQVCSITTASTGTLRLNAVGVCRLEGFLTETRSSKQSDKAQLTFNVLPKPKPPMNVDDVRAYYIGESSVRVAATSISNGPITYTSQTPTICFFASSTSPTLSLRTTGTCTFTVFTPETSSFEQSAIIQKSFQVLPNRVAQSRVRAPFEVDEVYLDLGSVDFNLISDSRDPVKVVIDEARSNGSCRLEAGNTLRLLKAGNCHFQASIDQTVAYLAYSESLFIPIKPARQELALSVPETISLKEKSFSFVAELPSGLPLTVTSLDVQRCRVKNTGGKVTVTMFNIGNCRIKLVSKSDPNYEQVNATETVRILPFNTTITCQAGKLARKTITGFRPKCPPGYKQVG